MPRPVTRRHRLRGPARRRCSFTAYLLFLAAGAATGIALAVDFIGTHSGACTGSDSRGRCLLDHAYGPGVTRFALVLICAHGLASLLLEVAPAVRSRLRAGYRLRRAPKPPPGRITLPVLRRTAPREVARAVCRRCDTIVLARAGTCLECDGPVVPRRG